MNAGLVHQGDIGGQVILDGCPNLGLHLQVASDFVGWKYLCEFFGILPPHDDFGPFRFEVLVNNFLGDIIRHSPFVVGLGIFVEHSGHTLVDPFQLFLITLIVWPESLGFLVGQIHIAGD